uniref:Uncharacterized protein n=1 Tax=Ectopseudomonas mendocina (strain ymp) TaxID=399739 RepID=A4XNG7_ECTM1
MRSNAIYLTLLMMCVEPALGDISYIPISEDIKINTGDFGIGCDMEETHISRAGKDIFIATGGINISIPIDIVGEDADVIVGDMSGNGHCDLAVPYGKSDVNESYTLFVYDIPHEKFKKSNAGIISNPDFKENKIISSYRDAAQWHEDYFCYSKSLVDFFLCSQKKSIDNSLEWLRLCSEDLCASSTIIYKASSIQASAVVTADRAKLHDITNGNILKERKGYLVKGDKVMLIDFLQTYEDAYYKVNYFNNKMITTGWVKGAQLVVNPVTEK